MATEMEFVNYKEFVECLSETKNDGDLVVNDSSNGPGKINTSVIFNNFAKRKFLETQPFGVGDECVKDGVLYRAIYPHSGAWDASHFVSSESSDLSDFQLAKTIPLIGANLTTQIKYIFLSQVVSKIRVKATPNPWPTDTIGGTNPSILIISALKVDGTLVPLRNYSIASTIPEYFDLTIPENTKGLSVFFRANANERVEVSIQDYYNISVSEEFAEVKTSVSNLESEVWDLQNNVTQNGFANLELVGKNIAPIEKEIVVKGLTYIEVIPTPNPWPTDTIGRQNPTILAIYAVKSDNTQTTLATYTIGSTIPEKMFFVLPEGTEKLKFFFRANLNSVVTFNVVPVASKPVGEVESIGLTFVGNGATAITRYYPVSKFVDKVAIDINPSNWGTYPGGTNPTMFKLDAVDKDDNVLLTFYNWPRDTGTQKGPFYHGIAVLPKETTHIKAFFRGALGVEVDCVIHADSSYLPFSNEDRERVMQNAWRRNTRIAQCLVVGDPHNQKAGMVSAFLASKLANAIDFAICVGDICSDHPTASGAYENYPELMKSFIPVLPVVGNHDAGSSYYVGSYLPVEKVVENVMGPAIEKGFIPSNTRGYYYKDFATYKLRVIVVNQYEVGGDYGTGSKWERVAYDSTAPDIAFSTSYSQNDVVNIPGWTDYSYKATENVTTPASAPASWSADIPCWHTRRPDAALFGQTQAQWIADTLLSTPANYGVVIAMHTWFSRDAVADETCKFTTKGASTSGASLYGETDFISDIVEAFKNGENYSETVSYNTLSPYNVACNFANKNAGVKFMGFIGGHFHSDIVFKHATKSWLKAVHVCASGSNSNGDIRLIDTGMGYWQHNFTLVGFDVANNALNLIKIGSKLTDDGYIRDCERIVNT